MGLDGKPAPRRRHAAHRPGARPCATLLATKPKTAADLAREMRSTSAEIQVALGSIRTLDCGRRARRPRRPPHDPASGRGGRRARGAQPPDRRRRRLSNGVEGRRDIARVPRAADAGPGRRPPACPTRSRASSSRRRRRARRRRPPTDGRRNRSRVVRHHTGKAGRRWREATAGRYLPERDARTPGTCVPEPGTAECPGGTQRPSHATRDTTDHSDHPSDDRTGRPSRHRGPRLSRLWGPARTDLRRPRTGPAVRGLADRGPPARAGGLLPTGRAHLRCLPAGPAPDLHLGRGHLPRIRLLLVVQRQLGRARRAVRRRSGATPATRPRLPGRSRSRATTATSCSTSFPRGIPALGIEPARNIAAAARKKGIPTISEFLTRELARQIVAEKGHADLVVANNVWAHVPDLNDFTAGLATLMSPTGLLSIEVAYLARLIEDNEFDTIYHEHFMYYSVLSAESVLQRHGLRIQDVEELPTHGGSIRLWVVKDGDPRPSTERVDAIKARERAAGLGTVAGYEGFAAKAEATKMDLLEFLIAERKAGHRVVGLRRAGQGQHAPELLRHPIGPHRVPRRREPVQARPVRARVAHPRPCARSHRARSPRRHRHHALEPADGDRQEAGVYGRLGRASRRPDPAPRGPLVPLTAGPQAWFAFCQRPGVRWSGHGVIGSPKSLDVRPPAVRDDSPHQEACP